MRRLLALALITTVAAGAAASAAPDRQTARKACSNRWSSMSASERTNTRRQDFIAKCMKGAPAGPVMTMPPNETGPAPAPLAGDADGQP